MSWKPFKLMMGKSQSWSFVMLTTVSVVMHGVVLGLPWPGGSEVKEAEPPTPEEVPMMSVAILPKDTVPADPEVSADLESAVPPASRAAKPAIAVERSPQTAPPTPMAERAPVEPVTNRPVPQQLSSPEAAVEPEPNALEEPPVAPGTSDLTEPEQPTEPTFEEQLQDPTAYQHNGQKSLGLLEVTAVLQNWVTGGQSLPSKVDPMKLPYQLGEQCLEAAPALGLLLVIVNQDGAILQGPEMVSSTGYLLLDDQAKAMVESGEYAFPDRDQSKAYSVEVEVQYPASCS